MIFLKKICTLKISLSVQLSERKKDAYETLKLKFQGKRGQSEEPEEEA